jgi:hypothetical protein
MISVMHGKHLIDFVRPVAELLAGVLLVLFFFADASKDRKANFSATGRIEFAPNRRATVAWLIMTVYFIYLVPVQFRNMHGKPLSIMTAVGFASVAIALLTSFPGTILINSEGLQQIFWGWKDKRIRWADIVEINTGEKSRTVTITAADGTKIVHSRQLPDRRRLLCELKQHCGEQLPADFPREPASSS